MRRNLYTYIIIFLLILTSSIARGQVGLSNPNYDRLGFSSNGVSGGINESYLQGQGGQGQNGVNNPNGMYPEDSIKPKKPKKPLASFYFTDSMQQEKIFTWTVDPNFNSVTRQVVDTLLDNFQIDYTYMKEGLGSMSLGNLAGGTLPIEYFYRPKNLNFSFIESWNSYIMRPEGVNFYNAKIPYSRLEYEMSGQTKLEENLFRIIFSANASPSTSFNVQYKSDGTKGMYMHQKGLDRYFTLSGAHTGKRYAIHGGYIFNYGNIYENGGIRDDREVTDTVLATPDQIEVKLKDAENTYRGHTIWWSQSYAIPLREQTEDEFTLEKVPTIYIGQSFNYTKFAKNYTAVNDTALYEHYYISDLATDDSVSQSLLDANFFAQYQPYDRNGVLGLISAGLGYEHSVYKFYLPEELWESYGTNGKDGKSSPYLYGGLNGKVGKYASWDANLKYFFAGYRAQNLDINGKISLSAYIKDKPLTLTAGISFMLSNPDYWAEKYYSNHYIWNNTFDKEKTLKMYGNFTIPSIGLDLGVNYELANSKIYYDSIATPQQAQNTVSVLGVHLYKNFIAGGFHFNHKFLAQVSSDETVAPVPSLSAYISYYYEFNVVKNVLRMQIGIDGRYNTKYYAPGWDPALGKFYNQREKQLGSYPYLDAFVTAKWKRMLILIKVQHFNCNFFPKNREYFQILHHPQNRLMLKFGVSWSFYD